LYWFPLLFRYLFPYS